MNEFVNQRISASINVYYLNNPTIAYHKSYLNKISFYKTKASLVDTINHVMVYDQITPIEFTHKVINKGWYLSIINAYKNSFWTFYKINSTETNYPIFIYVPLLTSTDNINCSLIWDCSEITWKKLNDLDLNKVSIGIT